VKQCPLCTTWLVIRTTKRNGPLAIRYWRCPLCCHREREVLASESVRRRNPRGLQPFLTRLTPDSCSPVLTLEENEAMPKPETTSTKERPMTDRQMAVANYDEWNALTRGEMDRIQGELADAVSALQANSYVVLSQKVARLHRELEEAKTNRETQANRHLRALAATTPTAVQKLIEDVVLMRSKITEGHHPFEQGNVGVNWQRMPEGFGERFLAIEQRVHHLPENPHPEAEVAAIRAALEELRTAKRKRPAPAPAASRPDRVPGRAFTTTTAAGMS